MPRFPSVPTIQDPIHLTNYLTHSLPTNHILIIITVIIPIFSSTLFSSHLQIHFYYCSFINHWPLNHGLALHKCFTTLTISLQWATSVYLSIYLSIYLSVCMHVSMYVCRPMYVRTQTCMFTSSCAHLCSG